MASSLDDALAAAQAENELPTSTPEPTAAEGNTPAAQDAPPASDPAAAPAAGTGGTPDGDEFPTSDEIKALLEAHPELKGAVEKINGQLKSAFTPKLQEAAELKKQMEGLDAQTLQFVRELDQELKVNPQAALQRIAAVQQQLQQQFGPQAPPPGMEFQTETERQLAQRLAAVEQHHQQAQIARQEAQLQQEFDGLAKEFGREISPEERHKVLVYGVQNGFPTVSAAFKMLNYESIMKSREEKARNEASAIVTQKANAGPAPSPLSQKPPASPDAPRNLDAILQRAIADAGL